jgi:hypothetical protein
MNMTNHADTRTPEQIEREVAALEHRRALAAKMRAMLESVGLPYKQVQCYGSQIVITSHCRATAERWAMLLAKFATVKRAALKCLDDAKENKGTCLRPTKVEVWRTYAVIE